MAVQMPSPQQMRDVARRCGLSLSEADLDSFRGLFAGYVAAYNLVDAARQTGVPLVPFLLDGVAANASLNLTDGIHPNAAGHRIIAERLWPHLRPLLTAPR